MRKIRQLIPFELEGLILGGSGHVISDVYMLGENDGKYRVLVVYILKDILRRLLDRLRQAGLDPRVITSIELSHILGIRSALNIPDLLVTPAALTAEERISAAVKEIQAPLINLRKDEFAYTADTEKTKKSLRVTALLAVLLLLVFFLDRSMVIISLQREDRALRDEIRKTYSGLFPNERQISNELYQLKAHIKELREKESSFVGVSPLQLLLDLTSISKPGFSLTEITQDRDLIILKGECPSLSDAQKIKGALEGFLREVTISDTTPSSQNRTIFTITAKGKKT
jgi:type II secretory pathway component PulL